MNWRVHVISAAIFLGVFGIIKVVWDHPKTVLYMVLFLLFIVIYGAIYIVVKAKVDEPSKD